MAYNPIETLAASVYSATLDSKIFPDVKYVYRSPIQVREQKPGEERTRRPYIEELNIFHFQQVWASTALGFGGMGGASMTEAFTTVIMLNGLGAVFFAGRHAYTVPVNDEFRVMLHKMNMPSVPEAIKMFKIQGTERA